VVFAAGCGSSSNPYFTSCTDYHAANPDNLTSQQVAFRTGNNSKQDGNCCTQSTQCQSQRCSPYGVTCGNVPPGTDNSCTCYTP